MKFKDLTKNTFLFHKENATFFIYIVKKKSSSIDILYCVGNKDYYSIREYNCREEDWHDERNVYSFMDKISKISDLNNLFKYLFECSDIEYEK